ncbi:MULTISPECIES: winged helix DNA-binding protein [unclassified Sphingomonas]|uniref:winged helix DNA-binding protein n=1 Tax=unclassified Sphingomonas TaxID=196159 RepID=UPI0006F28A76|nr:MULTISPECIES: winged helix DNA-binding protein [unclassified Sphingomonas]KQX25938.1 MarR family transcriptional regulator [Sphingomonas sp. Root1294]KQY69003.1 MarR family transcriptional regulator [Sphingomonas sp. Root50]KRB89259.1 MarR family transcriptional regulator [Sphingomonas sp. Root720]
MTYWSSAPIILVFADTEEGAAAAARSAEIAGGRIAASLGIDTVVKRMDAQVAVDLVWIDVTVDHGFVLDQLLERIADAAGRGDVSALVVIPPALVDIVAARIGEGAVSIVVDRDEDVLAAALAEQIARPASQLREDGGDEAAGRSVFPLDAFESAHRPAAILRDGAGQRDDAGHDDPSPPGVANAGAIRDIIRARRLREDLFGVGLFADPAWDILLDLMAARIEGRSVAVSSLCIAAAVPATTALRWIKQLTEAGLLHRVADPDDGRRVFIELTDRAATAMATYFAAVPAGSRG